MWDFWRRSTPWLGSAAGHAAALVLLAWWFVATPGGRRSVSLDLAAAREAAPPVLLAADEVEPAALELAEPVALLTASAEPLDAADPAALAARGKQGLGRTLDAEFAAMLPGRGGSAVEFFGTVGHGNKIVFILDVSGSMDENAYSGQGRRVTRFERARQELVRSISQLYSDQEFAVLLFSSDCRPMFDLPQNKVQFLAATSRHKQQFKHWLASIQPAGGTDPRTSLEVALALYPDAIFLLTDGEFRVGRDGPIGKAVIRLVRNLNTHRIPIHTIAYQDQRSRHTLETIAEDSGGTFRFVK